MSPVPKIGRSSEKSEVLKIADDLAAKSRILRKEAVKAEAADPAEDIDAAVARLASLAAAQHRMERDKRDVTAAAVREKYRSLVEKAERLLEENAAAVEELGPFVRKLDDLDWKAIRTRARNTVVPGSLHDTGTNLSLLQRAVEDAMAVLRGDDREMKRWLDDVRGFTGYEQETSSYGNEQSRQFAVNGLLGTMRPRAETLRAKVGAIHRLLAEVAKDLDQADAAAVQEVR
jgi:hypothetical protein